MKIAQTISVHTRCGNCGAEKTYKIWKGVSIKNYRCPRCLIPGKLRPIKKMIPKFNKNIFKY